MRRFTLTALLTFNRYSLFNSLLFLHQWVRLDQQGSRDSPG